jgi:hypothetical protein
MIILKILFLFYSDVAPSCQYADIHADEVLFISSFRYYCNDADGCRMQIDTSFYFNLIWFDGKNNERDKRKKD